MDAQLFVTVLANTISSGHCVDLQACTRPFLDKRFDHRIKKEYIMALSEVVIVGAYSFVSVVSLTAALAATCVTCVHKWNMLKGECWNYILKCH